MIRQTGVSEQTFYRREKQYVGLEVDQVAPVESVSGREQSVEAAVADLTLFQGMVAEYLLNQSAPQCMISGSKGEYTNSDKDTKTWLEILKTG